MKKLFAALLTAVVLLPLSCEKPGEDNDAVVLPDPATKALAQLIKFTGAPEMSYSGKTISLLSIEITEASRYIVLYKDVIAPAATSTKATGSKINCLVGSFTHSSGVFKLAGFGDVKPGSGEAQVTPTGGTAFSAPATITKTTTNTVLQSNAARTWRVSSIDISVSGGSLGNSTVGKFYNGCNLYTIASDIKAKGVSISDDQLASLNGYNVNEVILTGSGNFTVTFVNNAKSPVVGSWSGVGENSFSYNLGDSGVPLLTGSASGTLSFPTNSTCEMSVSATILGGSQTYSATLVFTLAEVNS